MNRDEQRTRPVASSPSLHLRGDFKAIYPYESGGGTWIAVNEAALTLALLNWYSRQSSVEGEALSRGSVIPSLLAADSAQQAAKLLTVLPLSTMHPFRLIIIDPVTREICECQSDSKHLEMAAFSWKRRHWFSSGYDEKEASCARAEVVLNAENQSDVETLAWLRRLHRSHQPEKGAYSICMHREDACTVSCTEVSVDQNKAEMIYYSGSPCDESSSEAPSPAEACLPLLRNP
jgi:hypothetical protein